MPTDRQAAEMRQAASRLRDARARIDAALDVLAHADHIRPEATYGGPPAYLWSVDRRYDSADEIASDLLRLAVRRVLP
jgi:hypothetical protein